MWGDQAPPSVLPRQHTDGVILRGECVFVSPQVGASCVDDVPQQYYGQNPTYSTVEIPHEGRQTSLEAAPHIKLKF
jgi:hypothetical protein